MGDVIQHSPRSSLAAGGTFPQASSSPGLEDLKNAGRELLCAPGSARRGARSSVCGPLVDEVHTVRLEGVAKIITFDFDSATRCHGLEPTCAGGLYDVAVDFAGAMRSAVLARWAGARWVYGAAEPREIPASLSCGHAESCRAPGRHVVEQNLSVAESAGGSGRFGDFLVAEIPGDFPSIFRCAPCDVFRADPAVLERSAIRQAAYGYGMGEFAHFESGGGVGRESAGQPRGDGEVARGLGTSWGDRANSQIMVRENEGLVARERGSCKRRDGMLRRLELARHL